MVRSRVVDWTPSGLPFTAGKEVIVEAMQMWLSGAPERSVVALLGSSQEEWKRWKAGESFRFLVGALTDPVRELVHGRMTRLLGLALEKVEGILVEGVAVYDMNGEKKGMRSVNPREVAALTAVLVDKQEVIEERMKVGEGQGQSEEMKRLWEKLEAWSKANPVKGREVVVVEGEARVED